MSTTPISSTDAAPLDARDGRNAVLARNWWAIALRGVASIVFGLLTFVLPGVTLVTLVWLFAAYLLVDGVFAIAGAIRAAGKHERWGLLVLEGVVNIVAAIAAILVPGAAILFVVYLTAFWSILSGAFMTVAAFQLKLDHGRWLMALGGIASIIFGVLLLLAPIAGAVVLALWLGAYAFVFGILLLILAFQLRKRRAGPAPA